jgi:hypothetical protein
MMDVVATIIRNDIGILDEITELENSIPEDEAAHAAVGDQTTPVSLLSARFII